MIEAQIVFSQGGWRSFVGSGHAGYAAAGQDIVCAAFSTLVRTTLRQCLKLDWVEEYQIDEGVVSFTLFSKIADDEKVLLIADFLILGLQDLQREYPQRLKLELKGME